MVHTISFSASVELPCFLVSFVGPECPLALIDAGTTPPATWLPARCRGSSRRGGDGGRIREGAHSGGDRDVGGRHRLFRDTCPLHLVGTCHSPLWKGGRALIAFSLLLSRGWQAKREKFLKSLIVADWIDHWLLCRLRCLFPLSDECRWLLCSCHLQFLKKKRRVALVEALEKVKAGDFNTRLALANFH